MLRKITLALLAAGVLGAAALAPTSASAWWAGFRGFGARVVVGGPVAVRPFYHRGWCHWHPYRCF
jgi:hypothetical protein